MYTRVPPPNWNVASTPTILLHSIRRTVAAQPPSHAASFRETPPPPRPLAIRKQLPVATVGSFPVRSASGASGALPVIGPVSAVIQALIGDFDRFAKEWTEMFDGLSAVPEDPNGSVSTLQASTLAGTNAETIHFDVIPASLTRWQHRDKSLVKDTPEDRPVRNPNLLSKRLLTFHHYIRKETYQWLRRQIRRQTKRITYRKRSFETCLSKRLLRHRDIFRLFLR